MLIREVLLAWVEWITKSYFNKKSPASAGFFYHFIPRVKTTFPLVWCKVAA